MSLYGHKYKGLCRGISVLNYLKSSLRFYIKLYPFSYLSIIIFILAKNKLSIHVYVN